MTVAAAGNQTMSVTTTFLVVDDAKLNRKMMVKLLEGTSCRVQEAEDGMEAVSAVRNAMEQNNYVDVILMDYMMPNMNGPTAAREIRRLGYPGLIIGVTGNALSQDMQHYITQGADAVITKPVDFVTLQRTIQGNLYAVCCLVINQCLGLVDGLY
jgi:CheY-like chemotaxis protein